MKTRSAWFVKFLSCENHIRGSADPAAADFMRKSTTVRFLLFHRCANFFDYNTDFAIFDFDYFTDVPISYFFSTITLSVTLSIICGIGFSRICLFPLQKILNDILMSTIKFRCLACRPLRVGLKFFSRHVTVTRPLSF